MYTLLFCGIIISAAATNPQLNSTYHGLKVHKVIAAWNNANSICRSEGGYLASPINENILKDMKYLIDANHEYNTYFIGTRARQVPGQYVPIEVSGQYVSIEGIVLEDMPVLNMLGRLDPTEGDCLSIDDLRISVVPCWTPLPYICRFNNTKLKNVMPENTTPNSIVPDNTTPNSIVPTSTTSSDIVPKNTTKLGCIIEGYRYNVTTKKCYKYYETLKTWLDAEETCVTEGAHLVVVNDQKEAQVLSDIMAKSVAKYVWIWIGLRNPGNGIWESIDGTPKEQLYIQWNSDRPTDHNIYGLMMYNMKMGSYPKEGNLYFICEKRPEEEPSP